MTGESRKINIADELARASEAFREARTLLDANLPNGAVSRAYYAVFHLMRAALVSRDADPKTHAGAIHLFNLHLIRPGIFPAFNKLLSGLQRARELGDYDATVGFPHDEASSFISEAETFDNAVRTLLAREGWT
jgi:uncharacterized protein